MVSDDPLLENDLELSRNAGPARKLAQALELMETGIRLKRAVLGRDEHVSPRELDEALVRWLCADG